ncbi:F-box protein At3g07870-like [Rosa rugosa]|uniref:F-box protein At3g07870-like n=1 Tax=Rosa rugosa TaxID=74645 RepID=UPI002B412D48|nr:F-box protein At3g07870-like [Rosa rugosa]
MADNLPEDLIVQILEKLPIKSLIRFTSVSKRWRLIILSDPNIAKSQFQETQSRRVLLCLHCKEPEFESRDSETPWSTGDSSTDRKLSCPFKQPGYNLHSLFSCNGLVCAALDDRNWTHLDIYIWNPSTQFFKKLPPSPLRFAFPRCYGFGYLSATGDYKVLIGNWSLNTDHHIFSFNTNIWKRIESPLCLQRDDQWTLSNEALHLVDKEILAFDLTHDKFRTMPLPDPERGQYIRELGDFRGCLCAFDYKNQRIGFIDLWVMKEYNVGESWTKLFTLKISDQPMPVLCLRPIMVMETSTILEIGISNEGSLGRHLDTEFKLIKSYHKEEKFETLMECFRRGMAK